MEIQKPSTALHRFAFFCASVTWLLIVAGALVTSNDAGLSVPDWPLSYGQVFPPMVGNIRFEHGHRLIAATVGLLTIILNIGLQRREPRRWVRRVGLAALVAVLAQGLLGGLTVLYQLPLPVSVAHACLAQIFFCLMVSIAVFTSAAWQGMNGQAREQVAPGQAEEKGAPQLGHLCIAALIAIFVQLLLGAAFRHNGIGIVPHLLGALVVTLTVGYAVIRTLKGHGMTPCLWRPATALSGILMIQLFLGLAAYLARLASANDPQPLEPMISITVAHVAFGALTLAATLVLTLRVYRVLPPRSRAFGLPAGAQRVVS